MEGRKYVFFYFAFRTFKRESSSVIMFKKIRVLRDFQYFKTYNMQYEKVSKTILDIDILIVKIFMVFIICIKYYRLQNISSDKPIMVHA